uniref:Uncharacterized protein n=1 Tax=Arundo donax TaxID=35708 RepID=A0A0A9AAM2_ARUDO
MLAPICFLLIELAMLAPICFLLS